MIILLTYLFQVYTLLENNSSRAGFGIQAGHWRGKLTLHHPISWTMAINQITYCRDQLILCNNKQHKLYPDILKKIRYLKIATSRRTRRGTRGGLRKHRNIKIVHLSHPNIYPSKRGDGVNFSNLTQVHPLPKSLCLNVALWNVQSSRNKTLEIVDYILDEQLDILFIT